MTPCPIPGCPNTGRGRDALCDAHYRRQRRHGTPQPEKPVRRVGIDPPCYGAAHVAVARALGPATAHLCEFGCGKPAQNWAYDHLDPDELHSEKGYPYSTDVCHYFPTCASDHKMWDLHRAAVA